MSAFAPDSDRTMDIPGGPACAKSGSELRSGRRASPSSDSGHRLLQTSSPVAARSKSLPRARRNSYKGVLTRGRDGMVIFVPPLPKLSNVLSALHGLSPRRLL